MLRRLRHIIILLTALTFSVSSVGWSVASVVIGGMSGNEHHSTVGLAATEPGDQTAVGTAHQHSSSAHHAACDASSGIECKSEPQESGATNSCCAAACHTAMLASHYVATVIALARAIEHPPLEVGVKEASVVRFKRPPRSADA